MFTRRTATVTMSAPEAACACAITACDEYFPVPTIRRDLNSRPAITNGVSAINSQPPTPKRHVGGVYQLEEYAVQPASDRDLPAATTARPGLIWEGRTTNRRRRSSRFRCGRRRRR